ncbi:MAG TPA: undecaprenyl-diphosphate phosphatase [Deltaproteobacteria bacterium]|nr:undecaprenyl-diphosphate phosphatase [Deltaproteobacteria bacterium]HQI81306.1 undecaprenyl-diphosphate phosphatase [Deltaproteobacteria bacterium]
MGLVRTTGLVTGCVVLCCTTALGAAETQGMTYLQAVVLGVVEGLTEYLPVSSTGHLYLVSRLLGLGATPEGRVATDAYVIAIQIGAILAVLWLYPGRVASMVRGFLGRDRQGLGLALNTLGAFLPAAIIGLAFGDLIKERLFGICPVTLAWLAGGMAILLVARKMHRHPGHGMELRELTLGAALVIGLIQCIAMWPGVSRSLVTILGGVLVGLSVQAAVEFSFILGLVTLGAATCYEIVREGPAMLLQFGLLPPAIGILTAFLSAVAAVKWMVAYLHRHGLEAFGYYRIGLAFITMALMLFGVA